MKTQRKSPLTISFLPPALSLSPSNLCAFLYSLEKRKTEDKNEREKEGERNSKGRGRREK